MFELFNISELDDLNELIHFVENKNNVKEYVDTCNRTPLYLLCMNKKAKKEQIIELVYLLHIPKRKMRQNNIKITNYI